MKSFLLINDTDSNDAEVLAIAPDTAHEDALYYLGYRVEPKVQDDKVRRFFLVCEETGREIEDFADYIFENACLKALSLVGYSLFDALQPETK